MEALLWQLPSGKVSFVKCSATVLARSLIGYQVLKVTKLKRLHYVCFTTHRHYFIRYSCCCLSFWFAYLSKPKPGGNQLTPVVGLSYAKK